MTDSAATLMAIIFGIAVFAVIVVIGWRSVQNRRIVRLQGADGHETIIVASEDDEISSVETSTEPARDRGSSTAEPAPEFGRREAGPQTLV